MGITRRENVVEETGCQLTVLSDLTENAYSGAWMGFDFTWSGLALVRYVGESGYHTIPKLSWIRLPLLRWFERLDRLGCTQHLPGVEEFSFNWDDREHLLYEVNKRLGMSNGSWRRRVCK